MNEAGIPDDLKAMPRWVIWRNEKTNSGTTKVPYQARYHRQHAKSNAPSTWADYAQAIAASAEDGVAGIGIMLGDLGDGRNLCGIDLDGCIADGVMNPDAEAIVVANPTYWEVSPSGTGLKCLGYGAKPPGARARSDDVSYKCVEIYDSGRWFAVTGHRYAGDTVQDIQAPLGAMCDRLGLMPPSTRAQPILERRADPGDATARASAYLATMNAAVQGDGGHAALFHAACVAVHGFALGRGDAINLLALEYNPRCSPPWDLSNPKEAREFERKVDEAIKSNHNNPLGYLLNDAGYSPMPAGKPMDLSGLRCKGVGPEPTQPAPPIAKKKMPKSLLQPPGLVGRVAAWINETASMHQPELALANSIAFVGALLGKKVKTDEDGRTNFYCLGLGESGVGKDHSRKQIRSLAKLSGVGDLIGGEDVTSDTSVLRLAMRPACLLQFDEIGHFFATNRSSNASSHEAKIIPTLTKLFTSASSTYVPKEYAKEEDNIGEIHEPCLCLYGTATPTQVWDSISQDQISDGFMGRLLIFASADNDPDWRRVPDKSPPGALTDLVAAWGAFVPTAPEGAGNLIAAKPPAMIVPYTPAAYKILEAFRREARAERRKLLDVEGGLHPLWGRAYEQATKLALVAAMDQPGETLEIGTVSSAWAVDLVRQIVTSLVDAASSRVTDSRHERDVRSVMDAIQRGGQAGATRSDIARRCRSLKARDRAEIIQDLVETERVTAQLSATPGRSATVYVAR